MFRHSTLVSGIDISQFDARSTERALSIFRAFDFFKYDGVVNELDPYVSLRASGSLGREEIKDEEIAKDFPFTRAIETTRKLAEMVGRRSGEIIGVIHGASLLGKSSVIEDLGLAIDNLAVLERHYLESGCTSILLLESFEDGAAVEAYRPLSNIAENFGAPSMILMTQDTFDSELRGASKESGFSFVGSMVSNSDDTNLLLLKDKSETEGNSLLHGKEKPLFVTMLKENEAFDPQELREFASWVKLKSKAD